MPKSEVIVTQGIFYPRVPMHVAEDLREGVGFSGIFFDSCRFVNSGWFITH